MQDAITLKGDHEARLRQLLRLAQHEAALAQSAADPRMEDALAELEEILSGQLAALATAAEEDAADAEASGVAERRRQAWRPLGAA